MKVFLFILTLIGTNIFAIEDDLILRGGLSVVVGKANILGTDEDAEDDEDEYQGFGANTQFSYKWTKWEFGLGSQAHFGKIENLKFETTNTSVSGTGAFRHVSFGPFIKYITDWNPYEKWHMYFSVGGTYSILSLKLDNYEVRSGNFSDDYKFTYLSRGGSIAIGFEEQKDYKDDHQLFVEFLTSYHEAYSISLIDASDTQEVNTLESNPVTKNIYGVSFIISIGMVIL